MDFQLSEQQRILKRAAREYLERALQPLAAEYDRKYRPLPGDVAKGLLRGLAPLGYVGGMASPQGGGNGLDYLSYGIILEELARVYGSLALLEMVHHVSGPLSVSLNGSQAQKDRYLRPLVTGEMICCYAITEPDVGSGARDIKTRALPQGETYLLEGTKTWITNGPIADLALVVAVVDRDGKKEFCRFLVERAASGFTTRELSKLGFCSCPTGEMVFQACPVPAVNLFGLPGGGYQETMAIFQLFRSGLAMIGVGLAQAAIDASISYARERRQFGRPIGSFQMVQEMLADMVIETQAARLLTYQAYELLWQGENCFLESSAAKAFAPEVAIRVTSKAVQIHGAYGLSPDYPLERYFRDARTLTIPDGTTEIQKLIVGREVLGIKAFV